MRSLLGGQTGDRLELDDYLEDFDSHFWDCGPDGFWKVERQQSFVEPGVESWEAFHRGDWAGSLALIAGKRLDYEKYFSRIADHGFSLHRVRIVEEPIAPYLQWELHLLRLKAQCGEDTRVLLGENVREFEAHGMLPEIAVLGSSVMYEILYDDGGRLAGGIRFTDPALIERCREKIREMHERGEPLGGFFASKVAQLPSPGVEARPA